MPKDIQGNAPVANTTKRLEVETKSFVNSMEVVKGGRKRDIGELANWRSPKVDNQNITKIQLVPTLPRDADAVAKALADNSRQLKAKFGAQYDVAVEYDKLAGHIFLVFTPKPLSQQLNRNNAPPAPKKDNRNNAPLVPEVPKNVFKDVINHFLKRYEQVKDLRPDSKDVKHLSTHKDWLQYERELQHFALIYELVAEKAARGVSPSTIKEDLAEIINQGKIGGRFIKGEYRESRPMPGTFFKEVPTSSRYLDMVSTLADIPNAKLIPQFQEMQAQLDVLEKQEPLPAPVETLNFLSGRSLSVRQEDRVSPSGLMEKEEDDLYGPQGPFKL